MTKYTKPNRDFEKELLEIKKDHECKLKLIKINTLSLFEACKELIVFNIRKSLVVGVNPYVRCVMIESLNEIIPNIGQYIDYQHYAVRGIDGMYSISTFFSSAYFDDNNLDCDVFLDLVLGHIRRNFIVDYNQCIKEMK